MGTISSLMEAGLDAKFHGHIDDYFLLQDDAKKKEFITLVDERGLKDPVVMKRIGDMQTAKVLKPGIYKEFLELFTLLQDAGSNGSGGNGHSDASEAPETAQTAPAAPRAHATATDGSEGAETSTRRRRNPLEPEVPDEQFTAYQFSAAQEEIIKKRLEAEEEKIRQRLLARERKIRESIILGRKERQVRLGLKAEDAARLKAAKDKLRENNAKIKELRAENAKLKDTIVEIRPKRNRAPATQNELQLRVAKRKMTMAEKKGDDQAMAQAKARIEELENLVAAEKSAAS